MKKLRIFLVFPFLCAVALAGENPKFAEAAEAKVQQLRKKIQEELSYLGADNWAGNYYLGDGLGVNVRFDIAPKTGFVFEWRGCMGLYDRNYGQVQERDNEIHLTLEFENKRKGFQGISSAFLPIKWGERRYLISTDKIVKFCNAINYGREPRKGVHGFFLLRKDDHKKKVAGFPHLPEKYRKYLLNQPIRAEIVKLGKTFIRPIRGTRNFRDTIVVLNVGKKHGGLQGMAFHVHHPASIIESATVRNAANNSCEAVITQMGEDDPLPKIGWRLSTASRWKNDVRINDKPTQQTDAP